MRRFRNRRGRRAALTLLPATALTILTAVAIASGATAERASLDSSKQRVVYGSVVTLRGQFDQAPAQASSEEAPDTVDLQFRRARASLWRTVRRDLPTGENGGYASRIRVRVSGYFRAVHADGRVSEREWVRVRSRILRARVSSRHVNLGKRVRVRGVVRPASRRRVVVMIGGKRFRTRTNRRGGFSIRKRATRTGSQRVRVRAGGNRLATRSSRRAGKITVYRPAYASWYGPGFYGRRTACGQTLSPGMLGVAHKTLPCGTKLTLRKGSRRVTVRVIDRGPYAHGREFDLTEETKNRLGFGSTGVVYSSR